MRIALVAPDDLSLLLFCKRLIKTLQQENGHAIYTIGPLTYYRQEIEDLEVCHLPISMARFIDPAADLKFMRALYEVFSTCRIEAVINFTTKPIIYGGLSARLAKVSRIIGAVRGLGTVFLPAADFKSLVLRGLVEGMYRLAGHASHRMWFTNPNDLAFFLDKGLTTADKVFLTTNSINLEDFSPLALDTDHVKALRSELGIDPGDQAVIMVARMIWSKGVEEYVEAAKMLRETFPRVKFLLVGPVEQGSLNSVSPAYFKENEQLANIKWLGFRKDVRELYAVSDVAVLPSYYPEGGFPRALLEPMAMGKPVITTDTVGCRGPVEPGKNGLLVPPRDTGALAAALASLLENECLRTRYGAYSRQKAEREFDDQVVILKILAELMEGSN
jgi:N,N'-diacetylbacillosaminyl-diphospho-undecaprenol alpha-1,3-N-acetylgalactosaminyltransferase